MYFNTTKKIDTTNKKVQGKLLYIYIIVCICSINNSNYQSQFCWTSTYLGSPPNAIDRSIGSVETYSSVDSDLMGSKDGDEHLKLTVHYRMIDFDKSKLGFFFLNPKFTRIYGTTLDDIFSSNIVITPKPGLFPIKNE